MSIEPAEHCGHLCCDTPNEPFHDHFLDAEDCDLCRSLREEERKLRERVTAPADEIAAKEEDRG